MQSVLKCLRCSSDMELGRIFNPGLLGYTGKNCPDRWSPPPDPDLTPRFRILRGAAPEQFKAATERVKGSEAEVQAYRCVKCGYVELHAPRKSGGAA